MNVRMVAILALAMMCFLTGCDGPDQPRTGKTVTVQFRRNALGGSGGLPIGPASDVINGARVSLRGELVQVTEEWVVLEYNKHDHWIPRDVVLLIRMEK